MPKGYKKIPKNSVSFVYEKPDLKCSNNITYETHTPDHTETDGNKKCQKMPKNADNFVCEKCDFKCSKYNNYIIHLSTRKHSMVTMVTYGNKKNAEKSSPGMVNSNTCANCNRHYLHRSGLARHKKTCIAAREQSNDTRDHDNDNDNDLDNDRDQDHVRDYDHDHDHDDSYSNDNINNIKITSTEIQNMVIDNQLCKKLMIELMKSNRQLQSQMLEMMKSSQSQIINSTPSTVGVASNGDHNTINNINSHNPTFNMNLFLNEKCKDAMNMKDFVNSIQLNLADLENVGRLGYVEGMSNIFIDNLQKTDVYKRPVHCSDVKRETLYVKDDNHWERDGPIHRKMVNAVLAVEQKNVALVSEWAKEHPTCMNSNTKDNEKYFKLSKVATDGEKNGNIAKVIRNVAKNVSIDKDTQQHIPDTLL